MIASSINEVFFRDSTVATIAELFNGYMLMSMLTCMLICIQFLDLKQLTETRPRVEINTCFVFTQNNLSILGFNHSKIMDVDWFDI